MRKIFLIITYILIFMFLVSCALDINNDINLSNNENLNQDNNDEIVDEGPVEGGVLNLFSTKPDTLNPILTNNIYVQDFSTFIFESLVKLDAGQKPFGVLANDWSVSEDGLTWTFNLKKDIFWHDKTPFTAEDVDFTFKTILNDKSNSVYKTNLENVLSFSVADKLKFILTLKKPNSFTAELITFPIISKNYFLNEDILSLKSDKNMKPIGTGPYKYSSYNENDGLSLIKNEDWLLPKTTDGKNRNSPYISEINVKLYNKSDEAANAFQIRDIDIMTLKSEEYDRYAGRTDLTVKKYIGKNFDFVALNLKNPALSDKVVRQALAEAINKSLVISEVFPGQAVPADIPVIPTTWLYNDNILAYNPNPANAKEQLFKNGWKDEYGGKDEKSLLYKTINGQYTRLNFEILVNSENDIRCKVAENIKKQLESIGIVLNVKKVTWEEESRLVKEKKFDMALMGCRISSTPDISFLYSSKQMDTGLNPSGFSDAVVDNYLQLISEENDSANKKALFANLRNLITTEVPYIGLYFYYDATVFNKKIRGVQTPYIWDKYFDALSCYIPKR